MKLKKNKIKKLKSINKLLETFSDIIKNKEDKINMLKDDIYDKNVIIENLEFECKLIRERIKSYEDKVKSLEYDCFKLEKIKDKYDAILSNNIDLRNELTKKNKEIESLNKLIIIQSIVLIFSSIMQLK